MTFEEFLLGIYALAKIAAAVGIGVLVQYLLIANSKEFKKGRKE